MGNGKGKNRHRGPCEPLLNQEHMQMEVVKPPKNQNESFGHGLVLKITCDHGFNSNIQSVNSTVRCNKGIWKPVKPMCSLSKKSFDLRRVSRAVLIRFFVSSVGTDLTLKYGLHIRINSILF